MAVSAPDIHGSCLLGDFPSIDAMSGPGATSTPGAPPAAPPHPSLETYIFPQGRAREVPARWGASWALSLRATVTRRRSAASPLPAVTVRRAEPPETERRARPLAWGRALADCLHEGPPGSARLVAGSAYCRGAADGMGGEWTMAFSPSLAPV